jgi:CTP synthase
MRYVFVIGGVCSSIGKGLFSASLAKLFEARMLRVSLLKLDPYFNLDPGTMSPSEHGEVYVTKDGKETDLDLGHYERFTNCKVYNSTAGQIYDAVLKRERKGEYLGRTIQLFPHIIDEIILRITEAQTDVVVVEIGGTAGDKELECFLQAIQQFSKRNHCVIVHLSHLLFLQCTKEWKTKPVQHSVECLRRAGLEPGIVICRTERTCGQLTLDKVAKMCNVERDCVFEQADLTKSIYEMPGVIRAQNLDAKILGMIHLFVQDPDMTIWDQSVERLTKMPQRSVCVGLVGKYTENPDAYKSVTEALVHACAHFDCKLELRLVSAETTINIRDFDAVVVPGGFGSRGWEGLIHTATLCRTTKKPFLGICLGMQAMCVDYARNVCNIPDADSVEMNPDTSFEVVGLLPGQTLTTEKGGTLRLGSYSCRIEAGTKLEAVYDSSLVEETHRHRYEIMPSAVEVLTISDDFVVSGTNDELGTVEAVEIADHPFMIGVQFHPEFRSKLDQPHPCFVGLIQAVVEK